MTVLPELCDYDWGEAFHYANSPDISTGDACGEQHVDPVLFSKVSKKGFSTEDVEVIISMVDGENDGPSWSGIFKLNDGRFAFLEAGCDYTGWD